MNIQAQIQSFFHEDTNTFSYLVTDPSTAQTAIIDPVLDYDPASGKISFSSANHLLAAIDKEHLQVVWILETHAHADHLSAAHYLKKITQAPVGIGERICDVQKIFRPIFNLSDLSIDGNSFDHLFKDGEIFKLGNLDIQVMHTPGHTPACVSYHIGDAVFVGDTLFMPDYGTARADFPGGDANTLYRSIQRLLALPGHTKMYLCHDYKPEGRSHYECQTTVQAQREHNVHVHEGVSEEVYVERRKKIDATLKVPRLIFPSIQVNIRAGQLPAAEHNGIQYLKIPLTIVD